MRALLAEDAEVTLWNEGFLTITDTFIASLVNALPRFDFAALVPRGGRHKKLIGRRDSGAVSRT